MNIYHIPSRVLINSLSLIMNIKKLNSMRLEKKIFSFLRKSTQRQRQSFFFKEKPPKEDTNSLFGRKFPLIFSRKKSRQNSPFHMLVY